MFDMPALEHLGRHRTFKSRALWSVRDGKGLKTEAGIGTNLQKVAAMLNAYFVQTVEEIIKQNNYPSNTHIAQAKIQDFQLSMCYLLLKMK
jgi:hypothetical protein